MAYTVTDQWDTGFNASVTVAATGAAINGWTLVWSFTAGQVAGQWWNATISQTGRELRATNAAWNATIPAGGSVSFGFLASHTGSNPAPSVFTLNGMTCGGGGVTPTSSPTPTPRPSATPAPSPSPSPSPAPSPTPGGTPPTSTAGLRVQYRAGDTNATDNQVKPHIQIVNGGAGAVPLVELTVRYWYTAEGAQPEQFFCDYAARGCAGVTGRFVQVGAARPGADTYLEIGFTAGAGSLAAGSSSGEVQVRFSKADWTAYDERNDFSFDPAKTAFADWPRVTLYRNGTLVWGTEP